MPDLPPNRTLLVVLSVALGASLLVIAFLLGRESARVPVASEAEVAAAPTSEPDVEAVVEDMKIKQDIWKNLEGICRPDVVFGTNTSALPITEMATILSDPGRMIGMHFFNPAHRMMLLEIICTEKTSDQALARLRRQTDSRDSASAWADSHNDLG